MGTGAVLSTAAICDSGAVSVDELANWAEIAVFGELGKRKEVSDCSLRNSGKGSMFEDVDLPFCRGLATDGASNTVLLTSTRFIV